MPKDDGALAKFVAGRPGTLQELVGGNVWARGRDEAGGSVSGHRATLSRMWVRVMGSSIGSPFTQAIR